jgi:acetyl-CoA C-acetyltransferase
MTKPMSSSIAFLALAPDQVVIVGAARTPVGSFRGRLASVSAPSLGATAIKGALAQAGVSPSAVDEVLMGNVLSAGLGQAPARQMALGAGCPPSAICTTVNKVCASGLKAVTLGAASIQLGQSEIVVAGGAESMSNVPFYLAGESRHVALGLGGQTLMDGILRDGLLDAASPVPGSHMGECAEETADKFKLSREEQDAYATQSYARAAQAISQGLFKKEIVPVSLKPAKGTKTPELVTEDEEPGRVDLAKMKTLRPVFKSETSGTITAANASKLNDGASAVVLMSADKAASLGLTPLARIKGGK